MTLTTTEAPIEATITERGNGLPDVGDYVPGGGRLWRVVSLVGSIQTGPTGAGNWINATVEPAEWEDCDESDEFPAEVTVAAEED